jgi:hypothetical protein
MASTYSQYKIELIGTGEQAGTWGTTTNSNFGSATPGTYQGFEQAIGGKATIDLSAGGTIALTLTNSNAAQNARALFFDLSGSPSGAVTLQVPAIQKSYIVKNGSGQTVTVEISGGTGVAVPNGSTTVVYADGTDVVTALNYAPALTLGAALPVASGGTGITSFGTGVATFLGTPSSANLAAALTDETGTGLAVFGTNPTLTGVTLAGEAACADNLVTRATLKDYAIEGSAVGSTGATRTFDLSVANFFSATLDQACTFTFSNPPASGDFGTFVLELTNGGAFAITYPASVDFVGGVAPTLTASGVDQLVFTTRDGGTTYFGFVAGLDIKSP